MAGLYAVTAQKPTCVTHAVVGNFTAPNTLNLILGKCNRVELYCVVEDGLSPVYDVTVYGRICVLKLFRTHGADCDRIFLVTESMVFSVLSYDANTNRFVTMATGDLSMLSGRLSERQHGLVDPQCRVLAAYLYHGVVQVIPIHATSGKLHTEAVSMRIDELEVIDMCMMHDHNRLPSLLVLYQDAKHARHMKMYEMKLRDHELAETGYHRMNVSLAATMLIPVELPFGGVLVLGDTTISYYKTDGAAAGALFTVHTKPTLFKTYGRVDKYRFLLSDVGGNLFVLVLTHDGEAVQGMELEPLGVTCLPSVVTYLDNGYVYIGSAQDNSQLLHLSTERMENGHMFEVIEEFMNLGPIQDMTVIDMDREGQGQIVTCSGVNNRGTLRILRNGIAINEDACVEMEGIKGLWSLRESSASTAYHKYLAHAFVGETRFLGMNDEGLEEIDECGFDTQTQTLFCGNMAYDIMVQVTTSCVHLIACEGLQRVGTWTPPSDDRNRQITLAYAVDTSVLLSTGAGQLILLTVDAVTQQLQLASRAQLEFEIACIDVRADGGVAAVGLWKDMSVLLLEMPSLQVKCKHKLGGDTIPRSLKFAQFDTTAYLLCGLGDGHLFSFVVDNATISLGNAKKVALGSQPVRLTSFQQHFNSGIAAATAGDDDDAEMDLFNDDSKQTATASRTVEHVFASCDRPTIIHSNSRTPGKLTFSNVNLKDVAHMCVFNTEMSTDALALATNSSLIIGSIDDEIQRLHVQTIALNAHPRRIAHQASTSTVVVGAIRMGGGDDAAAAAVADDDDDDEKQPVPVNNAGGRHVDVSAMMDITLEEHYVRLYNDQTFDCLHGVSLQRFENVCCVITARFNVFGADDSNDEDKMDIDEGADDGDDGDGEDANTRLHARPGAVDYYVVGTAIANPDESEPSSGRILVYEVANQKLSCVYEHHVNGAVYRLREFNGKLLAGITCVVELFKWTQTFDGNFELRKEASHRGHVIIHDMKVRGNFILIGDVMKSVVVVVYKHVTGTIEEVARDFSPNWTTSVEMIDNDTYLSADESFNLYVTHRNMVAVTEEERYRLMTISSYHLGEFVNSLCHGSLVMNVRDNDMSLTPSILAGCRSGAVIVVAVLTQDQREFFEKLESELEAIIRGVGDLDHRAYRGFKHDKRADPKSVGVVDGDIIEQFLELPFDKQELICKNMNMEFQDIISRVEDASRIH